jgi:hypothetical protein
MGSQVPTRTLPKYVITDDKRLKKTCFECLRMLESWNMNPRALEEEPLEDCCCDHGKLHTQPASQPRALLLLLLFMFHISMIPAPFLQAHRSLLTIDPLDDYYCSSSEIFGAGPHSEHTGVELLL